MKAKSRPRPLWPYMLFLVVMWVILAIAAPAHAETSCTGLADALAGLRAGYGEVILWQGLAENGQRLIITANPDGSTWTALANGAAGAVCFVGSGVTWSVGDPAAAGKEG